MKLVNRFCSIACSCIRTTLKLSMAAWSILFVSSDVDAQTPSAATANRSAKDEIAILSAQNGLAGYDHRKHFQKKLLEFVSPVYKDPVMSAQLVEGLTYVRPDSSEARKRAADSIASTAALSMQIEKLGRITELSVRQQILAEQGIDVPGRKISNQAGVFAAKANQLAEKSALHQARTNELRERIEALKLAREAKTKDRLQRIAEMDFTGTNVSSGYPQNMLLKSLQDSIVQFKYTLQADPTYASTLASMTMQESDLSKIRLLLPTDGSDDEVIFYATEGPRRLGQLPYLMQHPRIKPVAQKLEADLQQVVLGSNSQDDLYAMLNDLTEQHAELERLSIEILGSATENAEQGRTQYNMWKRGRDYRDRFLAIINRIKLEGNAEGTWLTESKFDPKTDGTDIMSFASFIIGSGCLIAPGVTGTESAYVQLHMNLLRLQAVLEAE
jgi:hypothetical protein